MSDTPVTISADEVTLDDVYRVAVHGASVVVAADARERLRAARAVVDAVSTSDHHVYGLNSGLGHGKDERLSDIDLAHFGVQTLDAHAAGIGAPLPDIDVRALLFARIVGMTRGGAGIHPGAVDVLVQMLNCRVHPIVPEIGSVGASDLMHLAAIAQVAIGRGKATVGGTIMSGAEALTTAGIEPHVLAPQDALSLISGNATSIGLGALTVIEAERMALLADLTGILTLVAIGGRVDPFEMEVAVAKPFPGQITAADHMRTLIAGTDLPDRPSTSLQDPLSFRVMPQVHGALREQLRTAREAVTIELNARDDNPLVSVSTGRMIASGNFQPMTLALGFESLRIGLAHVGMLAERRMNKVVSFSFGTGIIWPPASRWSPGRYAEEGVLAYSAAAVLGRLKTLAAPVTLQSPPLDFDIEDHATLAPSAVAATRDALAQLESILTIEAVLAVDAITSRSVGPLSSTVGLTVNTLYKILATQESEDSLADTVERARGALRQIAP